MKFKILFIILLLTALCFSISQFFNIPPYAGDIFTIYRSGYFNELEKGFNVIKDSFTGIKMMSSPVYGWIFLEDIEKKYNIKIKVFDAKGMEIPAPGEKKPGTDSRVTRLVNSINPEIYSEIAGRKYYSAIPVAMEGRCLFCHKRNKIAGVMTFERYYDSYIYYSSERIIIFSLITLSLLILFFLAVKWDPGKDVKELFDK